MKLPSTGVVERLFFIIVDIIENIGLSGIFLLMVAESALIPIPSEVVMPFAGYLVANGEFTLLTVTLVGTIANVVGSLLAYVVGVKGGRQLIEKYGKYILFTEGHLKLAENLFERYGSFIILGGRLLPAVRTVISFPAGVGRMNKVKFTLYTFIGSFPWNFGLTLLGVVLEHRWEEITLLLSQFEVPLLVIGIILFLWFIKKGLDDDTR
ncbi:MAG: DedA family protein [Candidatus Korarchaeota archaeon]|nr:DedA family protein [Candidatus Korarchaeota archaeon]NIU82070.1 DedA family protein [Candidatus Thorarchaeota archaeon]NIW12490.1 DedA family protein [Candidatus Thorarchaeota archaeon]NIW50704.1 DedA family protein [Candidatus Korarchaeota archaeon]